MTVATELTGLGSAGSRLTDLVPDGMGGLVASAPSGAGSLAAAVSDAAPSQAQSAAPATRGRKPRATGGKKSSPSTPTPHNPDRKQVNLTLPTTTYEWFEKQAAAAPYEPTLASYLVWQLRELEKQQRAAAAEAKQPSATAAATAAATAE